MFALAPIGTLGVVEVEVERIPVAASYPLRQAVLRPHQTIDEVAAPGDDDPESATFGVIDRATGSVVGTATVLRAEAPMAKDGADFTADGAGGAPAWRLRYMATARRPARPGPRFARSRGRPGSRRRRRREPRRRKSPGVVQCTRARHRFLRAGGLPDLGGAVGLALGPARRDVEDRRHGRWP